MLFLNRKEFIGCTGIFGNVSVGNVSGTFLSQDLTRLAVMVYSHRTARYTLSTANPVVLDEGLTMEALAPPFQIDRNNWGTLVYTGTIRGINSSAGAITVFFNRVNLP